MLRVFCLVFDKPLHIKRRVTEKKTNFVRKSAVFIQTFHKMKNAFLRVLIAVAAAMQQITSNAVSQIPIQLFGSENINQSTTVAISGNTRKPFPKNTRFQCLTESRKSLPFAKEYENMLPVFNPANVGEQCLTITSPDMLDLRTARL